MRARERRVYTPEDVFERSVVMAIEREKLGEMMMDEPEKMSFRAIGRVVKVLENIGVVKAMLAINPLRSRFLTSAVESGRNEMGELSDLFS